MHETNIQRALDVMIAVADGETDTTIVTPTIRPGSDMATVHRNEQDLDHGTGIDLTIAELAEVLRRLDAR